jgi:hypothetical protein
MVNAKAAGVMFTLNPANGDRTKIMIEGNWGLGESVVSGSVTPDEWVVDKVVLEISKKTISVKELETCRRWGKLGSATYHRSRTHRSPKKKCWNSQSGGNRSSSTTANRRHRVVIDMHLRWTASLSRPDPNNVEGESKRVEDINGRRQEDVAVLMNAGVGDLTQHRGPRHETNYAEPRKYRFQT